MTVLTDNFRTAEFIVREANGTRSRGVQAFDSTADWSGDVIEAGTVFALVGGATVAFDADATSGAEIAAGILFDGVGAGEATDKAVILRDAEVVLDRLIYTGTEAQVTAALATLGLIVR